MGKSEGGMLAGALLCAEEEGRSVRWRREVDERGRELRRGRTRRPASAVRLQSAPSDSQLKSSSSQEEWQMTCRGHVIDNIEREERGVRDPSA